VKTHQQVVWHRWSVTKLASITFLSLAFSYWIDNLGFTTEGRLAVVLIIHSLGVPNCSVIYIINTAPSVISCLVLSWLASCNNICNELCSMPSCCLVIDQRNYQCSEVCLIYLRVSLDYALLCAEYQVVSNLAIILEDISVLDHDNFHILSYDSRVGAP
jgi:hypothetical protein